MSASTDKVPVNGSATGLNGKSNGTEKSAKSYNVEIAKLPGAHGKPDKSHHDAEMERLKKQIDSVQQEVNDVRSLLSGGGPAASTPQGQRRQKLRAELDELRGQQAGAKGARGKVLDELKTLQEQTNKKVSRWVISDLSLLCHTLTILGMPVRPA